MKILILGATGMLGYSLFSNLSDCGKFTVFGTARSLSGKEHFFESSRTNIFQGVDVLRLDEIERVIQTVNPDVVINCIGLIKQHDISKQHISAVQINALLPHQLAELCDRNSARLIHFSTDCVFNGRKGLYLETDQPDASDLYGKSKCLGEVDYGNHLTLRTSIIGHELVSSVSLVDWFLGQEGRVKGFTNAVFSGLPTCYIAKLLSDSILTKPDLTGLYHLSVDPIDKFTLISMIADVYNKSIEIEKDGTLVIDRSLDSSRLRAVLGLQIPTWSELVSYMYQDYLKRYSF